MSIIAILAVSCAFTLFLLWRAPGATPAWARWGISVVLVVLWVLVAVGVLHV